MPPHPQLAAGLIRQRRAAFLAAILKILPCLSKTTPSKLALMLVINVLFVVFLCAMLLAGIVWAWRSIFQPNSQRAYRTI